MAGQTEVKALPGILAFDALVVLEGDRRGASVQLSDRYFSAQEAALQAVDESEFVQYRLRIVRKSREVWDEIQIDFPKLTTENLRTASNRFRNVPERLPEVQYLQRSYPEVCFVVPEWMRIDGKVKYGARVYFFREHPPDSVDLVDRNIEATVQNDREAFGSYQGRLHGYPDCCIGYFREGDRFDGEGSLEVHSINALNDVVDERRVREGPIADTPIGKLLPGFFESPQSYAFFAHGFIRSQVVRQHGRKGYGYTRR